MNKHLKQLACALAIILVVMGTCAFVAHAATQGDAAAGSVPPAQSIISFLGYDLMGIITNGIANLMNLGISLASWLVALAGALLNFSINLTLNIKSFVDNTEAIFTTWRAIRDISSLFIIFFLLWAAFKMILGLQDAKFGSLIRNIVIAGALINFSFFFASIGIDASNVVSLQLYNAIAPANQFNAGSEAFGANSIKSTIGDGGLSDIFMKSLQITSIYKTKLAPGSPGQSEGNISAPFKIIFVGIVAIMIEIVAAASFLAAAIAFILRFVILIMLLAFSPIWFAAHMLPDLKKYSTQWHDMYKSMLIFMPAYLLLMYMALNVLTTSKVFSQGYAGNLITGAVGDAWYSNILVIGINAFLVIFLLNMPLVVAMSLGGKATDWIKGAGLTGDALWKRMGAGLQKNTVGRAASKVADSEGFKNAASNSRIAALALKGTRATATDYNKMLSTQVDTRTKFAGSLGYDLKKMQGAKNFQRDAEQKLAQARARNAPKEEVSQLKDTLNLAKRDVANVQNARKDQYAKTTNKGSVDTLFMYVARKNKVAAARMQDELLKKKLEGSQKALDGIRDDIKSATNNMKNLQQRLDSGSIPESAKEKAEATIAELKKDLNEKLADETKLLSNEKGTGVNDLQKQIDQMNLIS